MNSFLGWGVVVPCTVWVAAVGINLVCVLQPKPMHGFSPNFQDMFTLSGSSVKSVFGLFDNGNTFKIFGSESLCVFHKPMNGFSSNCQDMCTPRGSRAHKVLRVSGNSCCHSNDLNTVSSYTSYFKNRLY